MIIVETVVDTWYIFNAENNLLEQNAIQKCIYFTKGYSIAVSM